MSMNASAALEFEQLDQDIVRVGKAVYHDFEGLFDNLRQSIRSDNNPLPTIDELSIVYPSLEGLYLTYHNLFAAVVQAGRAYRHYLCLPPDSAYAAFRVCQAEDAKLCERIKSAENCWKESSRRLESEVQRRVKALAPTLTFGNWVDSVVLPSLTVAGAQRHVLQRLHASLPCLVQVAGENIANLSDLHTTLKTRVYQTARDRQGALETVTYLQSVMLHFPQYLSRIAGGTGRPWVSAQRLEMRE
ncbi:hypothetical protein B0H16DRAFT_1783383 [Mycena metata]|uniref:Uncharacterized protein n=1 Tax=Mycena metata TaxID=1033252 RepID=A0AAD7KFR6_9AGAR|nr:hypothetical protein B0H16DRAFT_1783383 [Mycena metata]